jgi:hypothetical protein
LIDDETLHRLLVHTLTSRRGREHGISLYFGALGVGWVCEHLKRDADSLDVDSVCTELDELVLGVLKTSQNWTYRYELFRGLVGVSVYLLERPATPDVAKSLELVARALLASSEPVGNQLIAWRTDPHRIANPHLPDHSNTYFNLGVPHGAMGPVWAISALARRFPELSTPATAAFEWVRAQEIGDLYPRFGMAADYRPHPRWLPVGWCYGDLGIASTMAACAIGAAQAEWLDLAVRVGEGVARVPVHADGTSLCHGSAGTAHMFARLFQFSGEGRFRDVAIAWYEALIRDWAPDRTGFGGYRSTVVKPNAAAGLLRGAAGVALSLVGAVSEVVPDWDRLMLVSAK